MECDLIELVALIFAAFCLSVLIAQYKNIRTSLGQVAENSYHRERTWDAQQTKPQTGNNSSTSSRDQVPASYRASEISESSVTESELKTALSDFRLTSESSATAKSDSLSLRSDLNNVFTSSDGSNVSGSNLLLMKQPLLNKSISKSQIKPVYSMSSPLHSGRKGSGVSSDGVSGVAASTDASNVSAGTTSSPAGVGPIRVQASLSEREELRRKLDGEVESANELRQKSNREIARKYQIKGTPSIADRMSIFDVQTADRLRLRSPSPASSAFQSYNQTQGTSNNGSLSSNQNYISSSSIRHQMTSPSCLDEVPTTAQTSIRSLSVITDDKNLLGPDGYNTCTRSASVRLLKHTSPVPYKRPDQGTDDPPETDYSVTPRRQTYSDATLTHGKSVDDTRLQINKRNNSLQKTDTESFLSSEPLNTDRAKSLQMRRKFFNQSSAVPTKDASASQDVLGHRELEDDSMISRTSTTSDGSSHSNLGIVTESLVVPSIAKSTELTPTLQLPEFNSAFEPEACSTIDRKKRPSLIATPVPFEGSSNVHHQAISATSIIESVVGTLKRTKKTTKVMGGEVKSESVKEASTVQKITSIFHESYNGDEKKAWSSETYEASASYAASSSKVETTDKTSEEMKMLEYLIRHAEILSLTSLPYCRHSIASRVDLNQMIVGNTINEMNAIYSSSTAVVVPGLSRINSKPLKPPRSLSPNSLITGRRLRHTSPRSESSAYEADMPTLIRKLSVGSTIQPDDYIDPTKPPPKPTRKSIRVMTTLMHDSNSHLSEFDPNVFKHKYPPQFSSSKTNIMKVMPRFPKKAKRSRSRPKSKPWGSGIELDESASVPPKFGEETAKIQHIISAKLAENSRSRQPPSSSTDRSAAAVDKQRIKSTFQTASKAIKSTTGPKNSTDHTTITHPKKSSSSMIQPYSSSQSSIDTIDGGGNEGEDYDEDEEGDDGQDECGIEEIGGGGGGLDSCRGGMASHNSSVLTAKSHSVDNLRNVSFSMESVKSGEEGSGADLLGELSRDGSGSSSSAARSGLLILQGEQQQQSRHQKTSQNVVEDDKHGKKVQKCTNVGRSISCREQKPGTNLEKRELIRLKKRIKRLHRSLDELSNSSNPRGMTPSTSVTRTSFISNPINIPHAFRPLLPKTISNRPLRRSLANQRQERVGSAVASSSTFVGPGLMAKRGSEDLRAGSEVLSDGIGDVESLTSDVSTSVERLCPLLDERVRDKIYGIFGTAKSLEELNCDSANETSSEGLEKVDHVELDRLTTETDGKLVTKTQNPTTASSTVDMRSRSSAFRDDEGGSNNSTLRDSAFSLNQDSTTTPKTTSYPKSTGAKSQPNSGSSDSSNATGANSNSSNGSRNDTTSRERSSTVLSEDERLMIMALHVGLKKQKLTGGGVKYQPIIITSYPHKDVIDPKQCPFFTHVPKFCFPDADGDQPPKQNELEETYSFMFTDERGGQIFGYCRRIWPDDSLSRTSSGGSDNSPIKARKAGVSTGASSTSTSGASKLYDDDLPTVYCIISLHRCFELLDKICTELKTLKKEIHIFTFLQSLYECIVPSPGQSIRVKYPFYIQHPGMKPGESHLAISRATMNSPYEHVNLLCLPLYLDAKSLVMIFASLLLERKVWLWSNKLNVLSSCSMALHALLYPFTWEHVFVPMTGQTLGCDLAMCPTPFLIGSLISSKWNERPDLSEFDQVLIVDLDNRGFFLKSVGDEKKLLPERNFNSIKKLLFDRKDLLKNPTVDSATSGSTAEYISECFLHFLVQILYKIEGYVTTDPTDPQSPKFDRNNYIQSRSKDLRPFLRQFTSTILFSRFLQQGHLLDSTSRFNTRMRELHHYREDVARRKRGPPRLLKFGGRKKSIPDNNRKSIHVNNNAGLVSHGVAS
ncbi:uncharacterized protein LOC142337833 isoform X2 [Convolutriloba macropyga]|uniref:uncharacterized protein LOC142337833 isoform X2 n=1 Tax=Convolutriloba macropyga TaxID=536237 RepID=UPI003F52808A